MSGASEPEPTVIERLFIAVIGGEPERVVDRGAVLGTVFDSRDEGMFAVRVAWSFELEDGLMRRGRAHETWEEATREVGLAEGAHSQNCGDD